MTFSTLLVLAACAPVATPPASTASTGDTGPAPNPGPGTVEVQVQDQGGGGWVAYDAEIRSDGVLVHEGHYTDWSFSVADIPSGAVVVDVLNGGWEDAITTSGGTGSYGLNGTCYSGCSGSASGELVALSAVTLALGFACDSSSGCD